MTRLKETEHGKDVPQTAQVFKAPARKTVKKNNDEEFLTTPASTRRTTRNVRKGTAKRSTRKRPGFEELVAGIGKLKLSKLKSTDEEAKEEAEQDTQETKGKKQTAKAKETKEVQESSEDEAPPEKMKPTRTTRAKSNATKSKKVMEKAIIEEADEDMKVQLNPVGIPASKKPTTAAPTKRTSSRKLSRTNSTVSSTKPSPSSTDSEAESRSPPYPTWQKTRDLILSFKGEATWATNKKLWDTEDGDIDKLQEIIEKLEEQNDDEAKEGRLRVFKGVLEVMQSFRAFQGSLVKHLEMVDRLGLEMDWDGKEGDGSEEDDSAV